MTKILHDKDKQIYIVKTGEDISIASKNKKYLVVSPKNTYLIQMTLDYDTFYGDQIICSVINKNKERKDLRVNVEYPGNSPEMVRLNIAKQEPNSPLLPALNLICEDEKNQYREQLKKLSIEKSKKSYENKFSTARDLIQTMVNERDCISL